MPKQKSYDVYKRAIMDAFSQNIAKNNIKLYTEILFFEMNTSTNIVNSKNAQKINGKYDTADKNAKEY